MGTNPGEIDFSIEVNKDASIYYIVVPDGSTAPTAAEIMAGVDYGSVVVDFAGNVMASKLTAGTITDLLWGEAYDFYVYATTGDEMLEDNAQSSSTDGIPLWGDTDPDTVGYYEIHNIVDLETYRNGVNDGTISNSSDFKLMADLDLSTEYGSGMKSWTPLGNGDHKWKGEFDGQDHVINGLYIDLPDTDSIGFFGNVDEGAIIANFSLTNVTIIGKNYTGAVAGYGKMTITNVSVVGGTVTGGERVGGLVGRLQNESYISLSYTDVDVTGSSQYIGGLIGHVDYTGDNETEDLIIEDVYTLGDTTGSKSVGGLIGYLRGTLRRGIAYGAVTSADTAGGAVGYIQNRSATNIPAEITDVVAANSALTAAGSYGVVTNPSTDTTRGVISLNTFYGLDTLVDGTKENGLDVTAAQLADPTWWAANLSSWDFTTTWELVGGIAVLQ